MIQPTFLFSGVDPATGLVTTSRIASDNLTNALQTLQEAGWKNVVFHEDSTSHAALKLFGEDSPAMADVLTPEQDLESRYVSFAVQLRRFLVKSLWFYIPAAAFIVLRIQQGNPFGFLPVIVYIAAALHVAFTILVYGPGVLYDQITSAVENGRWKRVRFLANIGKYVPLIPRMELDRRIAQSYADEGNLEKGLQLIEPYRNDPDVDTTLFHNALAGIYGVARDFDKQIEHTKIMADLHPEESTYLLGYAYELLLKRREIEIARGVLEKAQQYPVVAYGESHVLLCRGMLAIEDGQTELAVTELSEALQKAQRFASMPLMGGHIREIKGFLSIAVAMTGDLNRARMLFRQIESWLIQTREDELLARCRAAIEGKDSEPEPSVTAN